MKRRPIRIGLTGNIATGKSEVGRMLAGFGACVIDADRVAHEVMEPGGPAYGPVVEAFGAGILADDGRIDRARLGAIVFRDPAALASLEAAVHPAAIAEIDRRIAAAAEPAVVIEAIKLIEAGMHRNYDALWVVTAPRALQIERLVAERGLTPQEAEVRVDAQLPQELKTPLADRVFVNDGDLDRLRAEVTEAWRALVGRRPPLLRPWNWRRTRPKEEATMSFKEFVGRHPQLTAWAGLAVAMVIVLIWAAKDVGLLAGQWAALIVATILLAGLCVWIIGWETGEEEGENTPR